MSSGTRSHSLLLRATGNGSINAQEEQIESTVPKSATKKRVKKIAGSVNPESESVIHPELKKSKGDDSESSPTEFMSNFGVPTRSASSKSVTSEATKSSSYVEAIALRPTSLLQSKGKARSVNLMSSSKTKATLHVASDPEFDDLDGRAQRPGVFDKVDDNEDYVSTRGQPHSFFGRIAAYLTPTPTADMSMKGENQMEDGVAARLRLDEDLTGEDHHEEDFGNENVEPRVPSTPGGGPDGCDGGGDPDGSDGGGDPDDVNSSGEEEDVSPSSDEENVPNVPNVPAPNVPSRRLRASPVTVANSYTPHPAWSNSSYVASSAAQVPNHSDMSVIPMESHVVSEEEIKAGCTAYSMMVKFESLDMQAVLPSKNLNNMLKVILPPEARLPVPTHDAARDIILFNSFLKNLSTYYSAYGFLTEEMLQWVLRYIKVARLLLHPSVNAMLYHIVGRCLHTSIASRIITPSLDGIAMLQKLYTLFCGADDVNSALINTVHSLFDHKFVPGKDTPESYAASLEKKYHRYTSLVDNSSPKELTLVRLLLAGLEKSSTGGLKRHINHFITNQDPSRMTMSLVLKYMEKYHEGSADGRERQFPNDRRTSNNDRNRDPKKFFSANAADDVSHPVKKKVDFRKIYCSRCGSKQHEVTGCPVLATHACNSCGKVGHISRACPKTSQKHTAAFVSVVVPADTSTKNSKEEVLGHRCSLCHQDHDVSQCKAQWGDLSDSDDVMHYAYVVADLDDPSVIAKFRQSQIEGGDPWAHMRETTVNASDERHLEILTQEPWVIVPGDLANAFMQVGISNGAHVTALYLDDAYVDYGHLPANDDDMPALVLGNDAVDDMPALEIVETAPVFGLDGELPIHAIASTQSATATEEAAALGSCSANCVDAYVEQVCTLTVKSDFDGEKAAIEGIVDSGATCHVTGNPELARFLTGPTQVNIQTADGTMHKAEGQGDLICRDTNGKVVVLQGVVFIKDLIGTLVSVKQLVTKDGARVHFGVAGGSVDMPGGAHLDITIRNKHFMVDFVVYTEDNVWSPDGDRHGMFPVTVSLTTRHFALGDFVRVPFTYFKVNVKDAPVSGYYYGKITGIAENGRRDNAYRYKVHFPCDKTNPVIREADLERSCSLHGCKNLTCSVCGVHYSVTVPTTQVQPSILSGPVANRPSAPGVLVAPKLSVPPVPVKSSKSDAIPAVSADTSKAPALAPGVLFSPTYGVPFMGSVVPRKNPAKKLTAAEAHIKHVAYNHVSFEALNHIHPTGNHKSLKCDSCSANKNIFRHSDVKIVSTIVNEVFQGDYKVINESSRRNYNSCYFWTETVTGYSHLFMFEGTNTAENLIKSVEALITKIGTVPRHLHSDAGTDYTSKEFSDYCRSHHIRTTTSAPYHHSGNGLCERQIQSHFKLLRTVLFDSNSPVYVWDFCLEYINLTELLLPIQKFGWRSRYFMLYGSDGPLHLLHPFGCVVHYKIHSMEKGATYSNSATGFFLGVSLSRGGSFIVGTPNARSAGFSVSYVTDAIFNDGTKFFSSPSNVTLPTFAEEATIINGVATSYDDPISTPETVTSGGATTVVRSEVNSAVVPTTVSHALAIIDAEDDISDSSSAMLREFDPEDIESVLFTAFGVSPTSYKDPRNYAEAMKTPDAKSWTEGAHKEWTAVKTLATTGVKIAEKDKSKFVLVPITVVLKKKPAANGSDEEFKIRMCSRGDIVSRQREKKRKQKYAAATATYEEKEESSIASDLRASSTAKTSRWLPVATDTKPIATYAPTVSAYTVRTIFALYKSKVFNHLHDDDVTVATGDVSNAFCTAALPANSYLAIKCPIPELTDDPNAWFELTAPLYGLEEAPLLWFLKFKEMLLRFGLKACETDPCAYHYTKDGKLFAVVCVFVDDIYFVGSRHVWEKLKVAVAADVKWKTHDNPDKFLGMELTFTSNGMYFSQNGYVKKILEREGLSDSNPTLIPMNPKINLEKIELKNPDPSFYQALIGSLMHTAVYAQPTIAFALKTLAQHLTAHNVTHVSAAKQVFRYLQGMKSKGMFVQKNGDCQLEAFFDATWASELHTRKSVTGVAIFFNGVLVAYCARNQNCVTLSSAESELYAMSQGFRLLTYVRRLLIELGVLNEDTKISCYTDSQAALAIIKSDSGMSPQKHIDIRIKHVKEMVASGVYDLMYVPSEDNIADMFTKPLPVDAFTRFANVIHRTVPGLSEVDLLEKKFAILSDFKNNQSRKDSA